MVQKDAISQDIEVEIDLRLFKLISFLNKAPNDYFRTYWVAMIEKNTAHSNVRRCGIIFKSFNLLEDLLLLMLGQYFTTSL